MDGLKVLLVLGSTVAGIALVISAIGALVVSAFPLILVLIGVFAIASLLERLPERSQPISAEKDETHSPAQARPDTRS